MFLKILLISVFCIKMSVASAGENKLYYFERESKLTHDQASVECKRMGMNLASIKTELEFKYVNEYILKEYGPLGIFWLDGYKKNGEWIWKGRGEKIEKFFWHQGEPNNKSGREICLNTYDFQWNDDDCNRKFNFICEIQA